MQLLRNVFKQVVTIDIDKRDWSVSFYDKNDNQILILESDGIEDYSKTLWNKDRALGFLHCFSLLTNKMFVMHKKDSDSHFLTFYEFRYFKKEGYTFSDIMWCITPVGVLFTHRKVKRGQK